MTTGEQRQLVTTEDGTAGETSITVYTRALFTPRPTPARVGDRFQVQLADPQDLPGLVSSAARSQFLAVDTETRGTDYSMNNATSVVGIGLAWDTGSVYLPWNEMPESDKIQIYNLLNNHKGLLAHNVYFDQGILEREFSSRLRFHACTLVLYRLLSNEKWAGQKHGLKDGVMREILQWGDTNEAGIDEWLVGHGFYKGNARIDTDYDALVAQYNSLGITGKRLLNPDKAEMWRVPHSILGPYCVLDAEACYLFYTEHLRPILARFPEMEKNFHSDWMYLVDLHVVQKFVGIEMDRRGLDERAIQLESHMDNLLRKFISMPETSEGISIIESRLRQTLIDSEPTRYKQLQPIPKEPRMFNKSGELSKSYIRWKHLLDSGRYTIPVISKNWIKWQERWQSAISGKDSRYSFNIQSRQQLTELLYEHMGFEIRIQTESGLPATGGDALAAMGPAGAVLMERDDALKELGFINKYRELIENRDTIHPSFAIAGAATGRMSSKEPNLQQIKKTRAVMDLFVARRGHTWIDLDFAALEPTVTTEFSKDPNMEAIYGNGAGQNDIYLFVASTVPQWQTQLGATGYDRYCPTQESVARAKKECKHIRKIAKVVVLACAYGAGIDKILENLTNDGMQITREEVAAVHASYWNTFEVVKQYGYDLQDKWWETTGITSRQIEMYKDWSRSRYKRDKIPPNIVGYVMNGLGRPMCVTHDYKKDTLNRVIQGTGHDILVRYIRLVGQELDRREIEWVPIVADFHDAMCVEVPDKYIEQALEVYRDSLDELNRQLGGDIQLRGTPSWGKNMTAVKEPEE